MQSDEKKAADTRCPCCGARTSEFALVEVEARKKTIDDVLDILWDMGYDFEDYSLLLDVVSRIEALVP